jgi:hypothetical protein
MIQQNRWAEYQTAAALLLACAVLVIIIVIEWSWLYTNSPTKEPRIPGLNKDVTLLREVPDPVETLQKPKEYQEVTQRPLFFQGRRPIEASSEELDNFKGKMGIILTGVIVAPEGLSVLIRDNNNKSHHVKLGEDIDGWVLDAVYRHKIVLTKEGKRKSILLRDPNKRKQSIAQSGPQPAPISASKQQKNRINKNEPK